MKVIDLMEAERFLDILNPNASPLIFQTFDDDKQKRKNLVSTRVGNLETHKDKLIALNENGAGVFVTINRSRSNRRIKAEIITARAIWQEDDIGTEKIPELEPSLVIETSNGKFHRYWLIEGETEDLRVWEKVQQSLVDNWDSDPNVKDLCRVMRIPGFYHNKHKSFRTKIVSNTDKITRYKFDDLVDYFLPRENRNKAKPEQEQEPEQFDVMERIRQVLTSENYHGALQSLAGYYANKNMTRQETSAILKSFLMCSDCDDPSRKERAINEVDAQVKWAFDETEKEQFEHPALKDFDDTPIEGNIIRDEYLDLEFPPGIMGRLAENVMEFMRYPSKEIATEAALHVVNVLAGSYYNYDGIPNHRRSVILAKQGRGKNVINMFTEAVCKQLFLKNKMNLAYLDFVGNGDYTSPKQMHLELQEFGSRSMISSEAGHTQATTAGDRVGLRGYENQVVMNDPNTICRPPRRQNTITGDNQMKPLMSVCLSIIHESVLDNYAKLFANREAFSDGTISRTTFLFIDPHIRLEDKNLQSSKAKIKHEFLNILEMIARQYIEKCDPTHANVGSEECYNMEASDEVEDLFHQLENLYLQKRNVTDSEAEDAVLVRKILLIKQTAKLLAILDNPTAPRITLDHAKWAVLRSDKVTTNMLYHSTSGSLSGGMNQLIMSSKLWMTRYLSNKTKLQCTTMERKTSCISGQVFRRCFFNGQAKLIALVKKEPAFTYKTNVQIYDTLLKEMESCGILIILASKNIWNRPYNRVLTAKDFKVLFDVKKEGKRREKEHYGRNE